MTREEQTDWLCRLRADLNNGVIFTPWNKEFTEALTSILEQESVLNKIIAEIDLLSDSECDGNTTTIYTWKCMKRKVFDIINKYKAESENKNEDKVQ